MSKVRIVQLLCRQRHCIVATAYESPDGEPMPEMTARLKQQFAALIVAGVNPWCGICRSSVLSPEDQATRFQTMREALPCLRELEREQAATREFFRASRG